MNGGIRWTNGEELRLHSPAMVKPIDIVGETGLGVKKNRPRHVRVFGKEPG